VKIYVALSERHSGKKKDRVKLRKPSKFDLSNVLFLQGFKNLALFMTKLRVLVRSFPATLNQHPPVHHPLELLPGFILVTHSRRSRSNI